MGGWALRPLLNTRLMLLASVEKERQISNMAP